MQKVLTLAFAAALLAGGAHAQTRSAARPGTKAPVKRPVATTHKAVAKPTPAAARPAAAMPAAAPAAAATAPAPRASQPTSATKEPVSNNGALFQKGTNAVNLGVGFGIDYGYGYGSSASSLPALSVSYMRGLVDAGPGVISVGGIAGYKGYSWESGGSKATWRNIYVGGRGAYHYNFGNPKLDTYGGLGMGLRVVTYSDNYTGTDVRNSASGSQLELSGFLGGRYFFSDKIGGFAELGYDMSYLKVGLSARF